MTPPAKPPKADCSRELTDGEVAEVRDQSRLMAERGFTVKEAVSVWPSEVGIDYLLDPGPCAQIKPHERLYSVGLFLLTGYGPYGGLRHKSGHRAMGWRDGLWICGGGDSAGLMACEAVAWVRLGLAETSTEPDPYKGHVQLVAGSELPRWMDWAWANLATWPDRDPTAWPDLYVGTLVVPSIGGKP
jgi:hypothetical protein